MNAVLPVNPRFEEFFGARRGGGERWESESGAGSAGFKSLTCPDVASSFQQFSTNIMNRIPPILLLLLLLGTTGVPADWPQYHGPTFNNQSPEKIAGVWPGGGPREVWRRPFNTGFSSLAVGGGRAYTLVRRNIDSVHQEGVVAVDAGTGKELWFQPLCAASYQGGGDSGAPHNQGGTDRGRHRAWMGIGSTPIRRK